MMASETSAAVPSFHSSSHTYSDLRSERRARNRDRKHRKKYGNFRTIYPGWQLAVQPNDLPSSSSQQSHYLPLCQDHCSIPHNSKCFCRAFPADLSTAPVAKFTRREAYDEAQWTKPPSYKRSVPRQKEFPKWQARTSSKKGTQREIRSREWWDDIWGPWGEVDLETDSSFSRGCPMDDHIDWDLFNDDMLVGSNNDDYRGTNNLCLYSKDGRFQIGDAPWHRHPVHGWFRMPADCEEGVCACVPEWYEPYLYEELDKETFYNYADVEDREAHSEDEGYMSQESEDQSMVDDGWDMISNAASSVWSEIDFP